VVGFLPASGVNRRLLGYLQPGDHDLSVATGFWRYVAGEEPGAHQTGIPGLYANHERLLSLATTPLMRKNQETLVWPKM
jgi:hypothetical protein